MAHLFRRGLTWMRRKALTQVWHGLNYVCDEMTVDRAQGKFTILTSDRMIHEQLWIDGDYEQAMMNDIVALLTRLGLHRTDSALVDIGANIGTTTIGMLRAGSFAKAVSVEPEPGNVRLLKRNVVLNGLTDRVHVVSSAASDRAGTMSMSFCHQNRGDHRMRPAGDGQFEVPVQTIDAILAETGVGDPGLVWADTQGHEAFVLRGGERLFSTGVPTVLEIWPFGLKEVGTKHEELIGLIERYWTSFWMPRRYGLVHYPMAALPSLFEELVQGPPGFENALFVKD